MSKNTLVSKMVGRLGVVLLLAGAGGCQSTAISSSDFEDSTSIGATRPELRGAPRPKPNNTNLQDKQAQANSRVDPESRANAISEIRQKADSLNGNAPPDPFKRFDNGLKPKTPEEVARAQSELKQLQESNAASVSDSELAKRRREAERLRAEAQSHYEKAIKQIGN